MCMSVSRYIYISKHSLTLIFRGSCQLLVLSYRQAVSRAREREIETENHMVLVAQREEGRLKQEIKRLENDLAELQERKNIHEVGCRQHLFTLYRHGYLT